jgi:hypothetical protein
MLPTGWKAFDTRKTHQFTTVMFFDGSPEDMALLMPNAEEKAGTEKTDIWELTPGAEGHWVSCEYAGTSATVAMKLPDTTVRCEVEYDPDFVQLVAKRWTCFSRHSSDINP